MNCPEEERESISRELFSLVVNDGSDGIRLESLRVLGSLGQLSDEHYREIKALAKPWAATIFGRYRCTPEMNEEALGSASYCHVKDE